MPPLRIHPADVLLAGLFAGWWLLTWPDRRDKRRARTEFHDWLADADRCDCGLPVFMHGEHGEVGR